MNKKLLVFILIAAVSSSHIFADMTIEGNGSTILELSETGSLWVDANATLTLKNMVIKGLMNDRLVMSDYTSRLVLDNTTLHLDGNYSFTNGAIIVLNDSKITGTHKFSYLTNMTSTINKDSVLKIDFCTTFSYSPDNGAREKADAKTLIEFEDRTAALFLNGATLHVSTTGLRLTVGRIIGEHRNSLEAEGLTLSNGIFFGDGSSSSGNLQVIVLPAASIDVNTGLFQLQNINP